MGTLFLDQFTYLHFSSGILLYFWGVPIVPALILHTIFEFVENSNFGMNLINRWFPFWPGGKSYSDTFINSLGDTIGFIIGWYSAYILDYYGSKYEYFSRHIK